MQDTLQGLTGLTGCICRSSPPFRWLEARLRAPFLVKFVFHLSSSVYGLHGLKTNSKNLKINRFSIGMDNLFQVYIYFQLQHVGFLLSRFCIKQLYSTVHEAFLRFCPTFAAQLNKVSPARNFISIPQLAAFQLQLPCPNHQLLGLQGIFVVLCGWITIHPWRLTWNKSWKFGVDHFPFDKWVICRFQPFIFQGLFLPSSKFFQVCPSKGFSATKNTTRFLSSQLRS